MFEDFDDPGDVHVPDDALTRARASGSARVRRRNTALGIAAAVLVVAIAVPLLRAGDPKTDVKFANEPGVTQPTVDDSTTAASCTQTDSCATTTSAASSPKPSLVPTGLFAGIEHWGQDNQSVVAMHFDGSARRVLVKSALPLRASDFAWSPDRSKLAIFTIDTTGAARPIYGQPVRLDVFDVASGHVRTVYEAPHGEMFQGVVWSPDSSKLAMASGAYKFVDPTFPTAEIDSPDLRVVDVDSGDTWTVPASKDMQGTKWSRDGTEIAYASGQQGETLHVVDAHARTTKDVVESVGSWSWSPDASTFAFTQYDPSSWTTHGVEAIDADGSNRRALVDSQAGLWLYATPRWSPDGARVLADYRSSTPDGPQGSVVVDAQTKKLTRFEGYAQSCGDAAASCWDGSDAALLVKLGFYAVYRVPMDGGDPVAATDGILGQFQQSPADANLIAYSLQGGEVRVKRIGDAGSTSITKTGQVAYWTPDGTAVIVSDPQTNDAVVIRVDGRGTWQLHAQYPGH